MYLLHTYFKLISGNDTLTGMDNTTKWLAEASDCSERYTNDVQNVTGTRDWWYIFLDIVQGSVSDLSNIIMRF